MNDRRFIELLNLYIDDQIDPAGAAELEAEVVRNADRRSIYNDYCRLQRGCSLLGDGARAHAPSSTIFARSLRDAERKISAPRRTIWRPAYTGMFSAAAVAACVAVVVVVNTREVSVSPSGGEQLAAVGAGISSASSTGASNESALPLISVASQESLPFEFQPVLSAAALGVARNSREAEIASSDREALEWMQRVELLAGSRVVVDEQAFEGRPTLHQDNRVFRSRQALQGKAEFTAFQFQR